MSEAGYRDAWESYKTALADLHGASAFEAIGALPPSELAQPDPEAVVEAADRCIDASARAQAELEELLTSNDADVSGDAARRLGALAGVDLHTAVELARRDEPEEGVAVSEPSPPVLPEGLAELGGILDEDLPARGEAGTESLAQPVPQPPQAADVAKLQTAASEAFDSILKGASEQATDAVKGLGTSAAAGALTAAIGNALDGILADAPTPHGLRRLLGRAVELVKSALRKLSRVLPAQISDFIRKKVEDWVASGGLAAAALGVIWDLPAQRSRASACIRRADDGNVVSSADERVNALAQAFAKQIRVVGWVTRILNEGGSLLARIAPPWSDVAVAATYVTAAGYAVVSGGDYVDGDHSTNFVKGVPGIVC